MSTTARFLLMAPPGAPAVPTNVLITPHVAMVGPDIEQRRFELIAENCRRLLVGEPLRYVVADKVLGF